MVLQPAECFLRATRTLPGSKRIEAISASYFSPIPIIPRSCGIRALSSLLRWVAPFSGPGYDADIMVRNGSFACIGLLLALLALPQFAQQPVWSDEFDGPAGAAPDATKWGYDLGASGWGNEEWQEYTSSRENVALDGKGMLVLRARKESEHRYTSARLKTSGKFAVKYGRIEARMRIPAGQGMWPAFWMLGECGPRVPWPQRGEIDIMENIGKEPGVVHGTIHGPGYAGANSISGAFTLPAGERFSDDFHVYAVDWREDALRFMVDGKPFHTVEKSGIPAGTDWVFDEPFFILLNLAVGGRWPGNPDHTTQFPQELTVDWVRVYP